MSNLPNLDNMVGKELGVSEWLTVAQSDIDSHAKTTGEDVWIHTDPARAATDSTFDGTIAQGSLIISYLSKMFRSIEMPDDNIAYLLNYGFDRVRLVQPVEANSRIRGRFELKKLDNKGHHGALAYLDVAVELEHDDIAPALVAEWLVYFRLTE